MPKDPEGLSGYKGVKFVTDLFLDLQPPLCSQHFLGPVPPNRLIRIQRHSGPSLSEMKAFEWLYSR